LPYPFPEARAESAQGMPTIYAFRMRVARRLRGIARDRTHCRGLPAGGSSFDILAAGVIVDLGSGCFTGAVGADATWNRVTKRWYQS